MRRSLPTLMVVLVAMAAWLVTQPIPGASPAGNDAIMQAYAAHEADVPVRGAGAVTKVLPDDDDGSRHQRFILAIAPGHTVLVAHNIDLAPRIPDLQPGDTVSFSGEYAWNERGGVVHWTHHDPAGRHAGGWLEHAGTTYE